MPSRDWTEEELWEIEHEPCCMCPNPDYPKNKTCPGVPGTDHPDPTPCRVFEENPYKKGKKEATK
jgi:hypothetical protein